MKEKMRKETEKKSEPFLVLSFMVFLLVWASGLPLFPFISFFSAVLRSTNILCKHNYFIINIYYLFIFRPLYLFAFREYRRENFFFFKKKSIFRCFSSP